MIRGGFLSAEDRRHLIALARDGSAASRPTRRSGRHWRGWRSRRTLLPAAGNTAIMGGPDDNSGAS